jgi:hypothetical protein
LNTVIRKGPPGLKLLAPKDESLVIRRYAVLILNFGMKIIDGIRMFNLQSESPPSEVFDKQLHFWRYKERVDDKLCTPTREIMNSYVFRSIVFDQMLYLCI